MDVAQFSLSYRDAVLVTHHTPASVAIRIAREFFDETLRRCAQLGEGRVGSRRADLPGRRAVAV